MISKRTLQLAAECITLVMQPLSEYANRYHLEPDKWKSLRSKYDRYQQLAEALREIEAEIRQGRMEI